MREDLPRLTGEIGDLAEAINYWSHKKHHWDGKRCTNDECNAETPRSPIDVLLLIHEEVTEAFNELRDGHGLNHVRHSWQKGPDTKPGLSARTNSDGSWSIHIGGDHWRLMDDNDWLEWGYVKKPEGFPIELADILIRVLDAAHEWGIDIEAAIRTKMAYNWTRPHRHGRAM